MIQFSLRCGNDHQFDSWFQSSGAYEKLRGAGMVTCSVCGDTAIEKAVMAPRVRTSRKADSPDAPRERPLSQPASPAEQALAELKKKIEANSDYVGRDFAREARAMHDGSAPARSIYGEAHRDEARQLLEDGIPVAPLPFRPERKSN